MFDYDAAFSRNLGWVTEAEQQQLRQKCIAIAGLGGVGGSHLLTLARLGIGAFKLADFDTFDVPNFNRQAGAMVSTLGQPKVDVLQRMALDINPELRVTTYPAGVDDSNLDNFLQDVDLYVDSLDFFAFDARKKMFAACATKGIPAITAAPLGMGTAMLIFMPGKMTFEKYFRLEGYDEFEQGIRFLLGLAPARLHMSYLVDPTRIDLANRKGPSTGMACQLCAGVAATNALKILLNRGNIISAPRGMHFDAYHNVLRYTNLPNGNNSVIQKFKIQLARKILQRDMVAIPPTTSVADNASVIEKILDLARWAPSGDNTQVWRFELTGENSVAIHTFDTRNHVVYDINGRPSQLAVGTLLENIRIVASTYGLRVECARRGTANNAIRPIFDINLIPDANIQPDSLAEQITTRRVQRRPLSTRLLSTLEKQHLELALGADFEIQWHEGLKQRLSIALLLFQNAKIRLTMPEAYEGHKSIIEWNAQFSEDKVPDKAVGMDPVGLKLMRWAMHSWERVNMLNKWFAGTWLPRIQLDLLPGIACGAHFILLAKRAPETIEDYLAAGRALQRFWLTATQLGLQMQPEMTPLIFAGYVKGKQPFSREPALWGEAVNLTEKLAGLIGSAELGRAMFIGRIGAGKAATARSTRRPLSQLLYASASAENK